MHPQYILSLSSHLHYTNWSQPLFASPRFCQISIIGFLFHFLALQFNHHTAQSPSENSNKTILFHYVNSSIASCGISCKNYTRLTLLQSHRPSVSSWNTRIPFWLLGFLCSFCWECSPKSFSLPPLNLLQSLLNALSAPYKAGPT